MTGEAIRAGRGAAGAPGSGGTTTTVAAQIVADGRRFSLVRPRERFYDNFWLIPAAFLVGALLLAFVTRRIDESLGPVDAHHAALDRERGRRRHRAQHPGDGHADVPRRRLLDRPRRPAARQPAVLAPRAAQLRAHDRRPRSRSAPSSRPSSIRSSAWATSTSSTRGGRPTVDRLGRGGHALAVASIAVFIAYVTLTIRGMRIAYAISTVAVETSRALDRMFPAGERDVALHHAALGPPDRIVDFRTGPLAVADPRGAGHASGDRRPGLRTPRPRARLPGAPHAPDRPVRGQRRAPVRALPPVPAAGGAHRRRTCCAPSTSAPSAPSTATPSTACAPWSTSPPRRCRRRSTRRPRPCRCSTACRTSLRLGPRAWPSGLLADRDGRPRLVIACAAGTSSSTSPSPRSPSSAAAHRRSPAASPPCSSRSSRSCPRSAGRARAPRDPARRGGRPARRLVPRPRRGRSRARRARPGVTTACGRRSERQERRRAPEPRAPAPARYGGSGLPRVP